MIQPRESAAQLSLFEFERLPERPREAGAMQATAEFLQTVFHDAGDFVWFYSCDSCGNRWAATREGVFVEPGFCGCCGSQERFLSYSLRTSETAS
jgi:hypothetical protein